MQQRYRWLELIWDDVIHGRRDTGVVAAVRIAITSNLALMHVLVAACIDWNYVAACRTYIFNGLNCNIILMFNVESKI